MITRPNCKINLGLHVVAKRPDGYHDLETVFLPVPLCDELEITANPGSSSLVRMVQEGIAIDCALEDNICMKAFRLLYADFPQKMVTPVEIRLRKNIPFGAGLGGGSSDAAFVLKMLNQFFVLGLSTASLKQYAARLGADCAFFIDNCPAFATGIGDQLTPVEVDISSYRLLMAKPSDAVSTREAYAGIVPQPGRVDLRQAVRQPVARWRNTIVNHFEQSVFPGHPAIASIKEAFYRHGAEYSCMSGSGATVFALFDHKYDTQIQPLLDQLGQMLIFDSGKA